MLSVRRELIPQEELPVAHRVLPDLIPTHKEQQVASFAKRELSLPAWDQLLAWDALFLMRIATKTEQHIADHVEQMRLQTGMEQHAIIIAVKSCDISLG